ncbi:type IV pilus twitching motility protein PilT [Anaerosinus massiliensis]|uniref:type IV pilus twitching motility protein PilT n=1 Tax=Massilibacillus massiliensis TaxID=1806837 RepID=UPI000AB7CFF2|nr:type IV pilus twitching motility protein PilT [Massilibacillus massiliensis]
MKIVYENKYIDILLKEAIQKKASDLHMTVGIPPAFRIDGGLIFSKLNILTAEDTKSLFESISSKTQQYNLKEDGEVDFSYSSDTCGRFRVNVFKQRGAIAIVMRIISDQIPTLEELDCASTLKSLALKKNGLVLFTGSAGSGKSTTIAAMIDFINQSKALHIITMEDPIEYVHKHKKSIVNQREIYIDSKSFHSALRAALREDPDLIFIGEMRDFETISIAITAAETGHLVFASLHTPDSIQTIDRIIDVFPSQQQQQIRIQLSMNLQGIISQKLLPKKSGVGRIAVFEIMMNTPAIRNIIREGKTQQIISHIQTGASLGMQIFDREIEILLKKNLITKDIALEYIKDLKLV